MTRRSQSYESRWCAIVGMIIHSTGRASMIGSMFSSRSFVMKSLVEVVRRNETRVGLMEAMVTEVTRVVQYPELGAKVEFLAFLLAAYRS